MQLFAEISMTNESMLMAAIAAMAGVVALLWKITQKDTARLAMRADKCETEHRQCQTQHSEMKADHAVLRNEVGHLREQLTFFREHFRVPPGPPVPPTPPTGTETQRLA